MASKAAGATMKATIIKVHPSTLPTLSTLTDEGRPASKLHSPGGSGQAVLEESDVLQLI